MKRSFLVLGLVALGGVALAHHVPVALSSVFGTEIMTEVAFVATGTSVGVPAYRVGTSEHHVAILPESSFSVSDGSATETVVVPAGSFEDPSDIDTHDLVEFLNGQLTLASAGLDNNTVVLRSLDGGSAAELTLTDGPGAPLAALGLGTGTVTGADDVVLTLSIPAAEPHGDDHAGEGLEHHPYYVVASTSAGSTWVAGHEIPLLVDEATLAFVRTTQIGLTAGFWGELDDNADATAVIPGDLFAKVFPQGLPERLHLAYVVFNQDMTDIEYVSNRFDVVFDG